MREGKSQTIFQNEKQDDKNTLLIIRQYNFFSSHQFLFILNYKKIKSVEGATVLQCNLMLTRPKWTISAATRQHFSMHKFHNDMIIQFDFADYLTHMHACTHTHKKNKNKKTKLYITQNHFNDNNSVLCCLLTTILHYWGNYAYSRVLHRQSQLLDIVRTIIAISTVHF